MATHSNILAWEIPWTEEPSGLQSMGSQSRTYRLKQQQNFRGMVVFCLPELAEILFPHFS